MTPITGIARKLFEACETGKGWDGCKVPDVLGLQAGSLDEPARYEPAMDIFTTSAQPWDHMHPDTKKLLQRLPT